MSRRSRADRDGPPATVGARRSGRTPGYRWPHAVLRQTYLIAAGLTTLLVVFQFITAGIGIFSSGEFGAHAAGSGILHATTLIMVIAAAAGGLGRSAIIAALALLVLVVVQSVSRSGPTRRRVHPLIAVVSSSAPRDPADGSRARAGARLVSALPAGTRMGAVHLTVADLDRSVAYYEQALGLRAVRERATARAALATGGRAAAGPARGAGRALLAAATRPVPLRAAAARARRPRALAAARRPGADPARRASRTTSSARRSTCATPTATASRSTGDRPRERWEGQVAQRMTTLAARRRRPDRPPSRSPAASTFAGSPPARPWATCTSRGRDPAHPRASTGTRSASA